MLHEGKSPLDARREASRLANELRGQHDAGARPAAPAGLRALG